MRPRINYSSAEREVEKVEDWMGLLIIIHDLGELQKQTAKPREYSSKDEIAIYVGRRI